MLIMIDLSALKGYTQGQTHLSILDNFKMTFTSNKESFICCKNWKIVKLKALSRQCKAGNCSSFNVTSVEMKTE